MAVRPSQIRIIISSPSLTTVPIPFRQVASPESLLEEAIMGIAVLGTDVGKNVCSLIGLDEGGAVVLRRRARRDTLIALVCKLPA